MTTANKGTDNRDHTADSRNPDWDSYAPDGQGRTDEQIRADVHAALKSEDGDEGQSLSISVQDGVVTLAGRLESGKQEDVLKRVRGVPSVKEVRSQLQ